MFLGVGVGLACFGAVLPMFLLYYLLFRSRNCLEKILLMSGLVFFDCLRSSFGFLADVVVFFSSFFLRETAQVVTGHTPTQACFVCPCSFFLSRRTCLFALFGRASCFLVFSLGCHSGPHAFLGFSWYSSEALSLDARRQGRFGRFLLLFSFSPSVVFCGCFHTN